MIASNTGYARVVEHYFAYGSNMNPERVDARGLETVGIQGATLAGFELVFDKASQKHPGVSHANVVHAPERSVEGVLYTLGGHAEILKMDPFETAPWNYGRDVVRVDAADGRSYPAWTYFANRAVRQSGLKPPPSYLHQLLAGRAYLSSAYYEWLQAIECADEPR